MESTKSRLWPGLAANFSIIRPGHRSRAIPLAGDRIVQSFELWYSKANPGSGKPEVNLWGQR